MTRHKVLEMASTACLKELYSKAQPTITWEEFRGQCELYSNQFKIWENTRNTDPNYIGKTIEECIGPRPYEFYYLPREVFKDITDSYVKAYELDHQQNLLDIIEILKGYCNAPIVDTYEKDENGIGQRGYKHPDNLQKETEILLRAYCGDSECDFKEVAEDIVHNFFEFLDMAGNFYSWNRDLNAFNTEVYLGVSPCSNKETVIKNWKLYRNQDITIDESIYIEDED